MGRDTDTPTPQKRISFSYTKMSAIPTFTIKIEKKKIVRSKISKTQYSKNQGYSLQKSLSHVKFTENKISNRCISLFCINVTDLRLNSDSLLLNFQILTQLDDI